MTDMRPAASMCIQVFQWFAALFRNW